MIASPVAALHGSHRLQLMPPAAAAQATSGLQFAALFDGAAQAQTHEGQVSLPPPDASKGGGSATSGRSSSSSAGFSKAGSPVGITRLTIAPQAAVRAIGDRRQSAERANASSVSSPQSGALEQDDSLPEAKGSSSMVLPGASHDESKIGDAKNAEATVPSSNIKRDPQPPASDTKDGHIVAASRSNFTIFAVHSKANTTPRSRVPDQSKSSDEKNNPAAVSIAVPVVAKPVLPIDFSILEEQASSSTPPNHAAATAPETIELKQPNTDVKPGSDQLAFAAKLVDKTAAPVAVPNVATPRVVQPTSAITPKEADAPEPHISQKSPAPPVYTASEVTLAKEVTSSPTPTRTVEAARQAPSIDQIATSTERPTATPVNEITVRIANPDQTSASIHMVDRSGELRVAVRASSPQIADALRGNVEQLASRLNNSAWSTEVWRPEPITSAARSQSSSQEQMSQQQQGTREQQGQPSDRNEQRNRQKYPDWVEEFYANNE